MLRNPNTFENLDHHCPRCDGELTLAHSLDGQAYALALTCDEPYCGYALALTTSEFQAILTLGEFEPDPVAEVG